MIRRSLWRTAMRGWVHFRYRTLPRTLSVLGFVRRRRQLVSLTPARPELGRRVVLFVHFDRAGDVRPYVLHFVRSLHAAGLSVVFVSNSGRLRPDALESVRPLCDAVLIRRNVGYDFGAWREALGVLGLPRTDTEAVFLVNDSLYGPLAPLGPVLERIDFAAADVWGLTESWQTRYHLQSYFLAVSARAMAHPAWAAFWRDVRPAPSKHWIVRRYEVGFTQAMLWAGLSCRALWPYGALATDIDPALLHEEKGEQGSVLVDPVDTMRKHHTRHVRTASALRMPLNPTSDLWRQLLRAGFPFLKRELLRDNPSGVTDVADWRAEAVAAFAPELGAVDLDLQRTLRDRTP